MENNFCFKLQNLVISLLKEYPVALVRKALILCWAKKNSIAYKDLARADSTSKFLDCKESSGFDELLNRFIEQTQSISIKELEGAFESLIDKERRKSQGAVYTPDFIAEYLIETAIDFTWQDKFADFKICDPSCGSGGFLIKSAEILNRKKRISITDAFNNHIVGIDNDAVAITHAKCLVELFLLGKQCNLSNLNLNLVCLDTLLMTHQEILKQTKSPLGYDIISTNPPYVKLQNLNHEYRNELIKHYSGFIKGSFSLSILFLIAGHRLLKQKGFLSFITQNNLYTSLAAEPIRKYLQEQRCVKRIIDFGHQHLFKNASAYTCLIFLGKDLFEGFEFASLAKDVSLKRLQHCHFDLIKFDELNCKKWRVTKRKHLKNLKEIENIGFPLGKRVNIKVGFATLKDKVFFAYENNGMCYIEDKNGNKVIIEREITRPAVKIADFKNECELKRNNKRIIFPYSKERGRYIPILEDRFRQEFPLAYKHLTMYKEDLKGREKGKDVIVPWYAWGRSQSMVAPGPKLLTKTFSNRPNFMLDETDQVFCNGYAIFEQEKELFPLRVIQKILNSRVMFYYVKLTSFQIEGDYQCYQKNFIEKFGIPDFNSRELHEILSFENEGELDRFLYKRYGISESDVLEIVN